MSFSYDPTLDTNLDHVRFLINDTVSASSEISDEEITAILSEVSAFSGTGEAQKYFAAAECLRYLSLKWMTKGHGVREKQVSKLRIRYGFDEKVVDALEQRICDLKALGQKYLWPSTKSRHFIGLNTSYPAT